MDRRLREAHRRWQMSGADADYAQYLLEGCRAGLFKEDDIALLAFLKHKPSQLALNCSDNQIVWFDRIISCREPRDAIEGLEFWGARAVILAAHGISLTLATVHPALARGTNESSRVLAMAKRTLIAANAHLEDSTMWTGMRKCIMEEVLGT